jgi:hypothetical protein
VGRNGANFRDDVRTIKFLLNSVPRGRGGADVILAEPHPLSLVIEVIEEFQRFHFGRADGRVDVEGATLHRLREFDGGGPAELPLSPSGKKFAKKKS